MAKPTQKCPSGMKYVPSGYVSYKAYSFPDGVKPLTRVLRKRVKSFCVSKLINRGSYTALKYPGLFSRSGSKTYTNYDPSREAYYLFNKKNSDASPVRGASYSDALQYCKHKYGSGAKPPSEKAWASAKKLKKINVRRVRYLELLSTMTASTKGWLYLTAGRYPTSSGKEQKRGVIQQSANSHSSVFRCTVQAKK